MDLGEAKSCLARHSALYRRAYIFGSVAKGTQDEYSDLDLVLIRDTELPFFDRIRDAFDLVLELGNVDLLIYTEKEYREIMDGPGRFFLKDVFQRGIAIAGTQARSAEMAAAG